MIKYFIRPDSNEPPAYVYVEGKDTDVLWNAETCIEVEKCPSQNHRYNMDKKAWELNETAYMSDLRSKRNLELERTDRYMTLDYPTSEENKAIISGYRQVLRDCPNQELLTARVLPECPEACYKQESI